MSAKETESARCGRWKMRRRAVSAAKPCRSSPYMVSRESESDGWRSIRSSWHRAEQARLEMNRVNVKSAGDDQNMPHSFSRERVRVGRDAPTAPVAGKSVSRFLPCHSHTATVRELQDRDGDTVKFCRP